MIYTTSPYWECLNISMTFSAPEISAPGIGTTFTVCLAVAPWTLDMGSHVATTTHSFLGVILNPYFDGEKKPGTFLGVQIVWSFFAYIWVV